MQKSTLIACVVLVPIVTGCSVLDTMFAVFGDHYSGSGNTQADKKYDDDRQVEASQNDGA